MLSLVAKPGFVSKDFQPKKKREYIRSGPGINSLFYALQFQVVTLTIH